MLPRHRSELLKSLKTCGFRQLFSICFKVGWFRKIQFTTNWAVSQIQWWGNFNRHFMSTYSAPGLDIPFFPANWLVSNCWNIQHVCKNSPKCSKLQLDVPSQSVGGLIAKFKKTAWWTVPGWLLGLCSSGSILWGPGLRNPSVFFNQKEWTWKR